MICHTCASEQPEAIVQGGSYLLRCGACGEHMVATSFIAVSDTDGEFSAYCDPGYGQAPAPEARIARGRCEISRPPSAPRRIAARSFF